MPDRQRLMATYAPRLLQRDEIPLDAPVIEDTPETTETARQAPAPWKPIVTSAGARTVLTAPATLDQAAWTLAPNPNKHMLWMQGRFVGADLPNRNGALWSTADLEMGAPTVAHGPLNWLHEDKHVIGTIADAKVIAANPGAETAATAQTHIAALSGIWRWIYPDEASIVQMASDAGVLAYSMECISEAVECAGDAGCGARFGYMEYAQGNSCDHLRDRSSVRRLVNPTFLGGAVIVPPTRPGWADANASILRQSAAFAEKAYDQAGRPDIPAATWELMMASVDAYTHRDTGGEPPA